MLQPPTLALATAAPGEGQPDDPFESLGRYLYENQDRISDLVNQPSFITWALISFICGIAALLLFITGVAFLGSRFIYGLGSLTAQKGTIFLGKRRETWYDWLVGPPIRQAQVDTVLHNEFVGPAGRGKTTLMEIFAAHFLKLGITTFIFETSGDLSSRCVAYAKEYGRPVFIFDPPRLGHPNVYKWNPIAGDPEIAAEQALAALQSASGSHDPYWKSVNQDAVRTLVHTASAYARDQLGAEPNLNMIKNLLTDERTRNAVLGLTPRGDDGALTMQAPWIDREDMNWWLNDYLALTPRERRDQFTGVRSALKDVLHRGIVRQSLSPNRDEGALEMLPAMNSGGLVIFRADPAACGEISYQYLILWMIGMFWQAADRRNYLSRLTGEAMPHVAAFFDEIHNSFPGMNTQAAESFAKYYTYARHLKVYVHTAFQAYALLPPIIKETTAANAANRFLSGRLSVPDAREAQAIAGRAERRVKDTRTTSKSIMPGEGQTVTSASWRDEYRFSSDQIRQIPMRSWLYIGSSDSTLRPPTIFRARKPPKLSKSAPQKTPPSGPSNTNDRPEKNRSNHPNGHPNGSPQSTTPKTRKGAGTR